MNQPATAQEPSDRLSLKWGTLKDWDLFSPAALAVLRKLNTRPRSMSAMTQRDSPEEKELICELIDSLNCDVVYLDWDNRYINKEEAKRYIREYGKK